MKTFPPGPVPSRQEIVKFAANPLAYFMDIAAQYGELAYFRIATRDTYLFTQPDALRSILVEHNDKFDKTGHSKDSAAPFLGDGLLVSAGDTHRRQRRIIQPVFAPKQVEGYAPAIVDYALHAVQRWQDGEVRDMVEELLRLTLNIVGKSIFGTAGIEQAEVIAQASSVMQRYSSDTLKRSKVTSVTEAEREAAVSGLEAVIADVLAKRSAGVEHDLISRLKGAIDPETGNGLSDKEVRDQALNLLMAGHETTANGLAWTLYLLTKHPAIEAQVRDEIQRVCGDRLPTVDDVPQFQVIDRVLKESLRLYPPVWLFGRTPLEPVTVAGYLLEPEANLVVSPYVFHRNPRYFPEPEVFNPDRFLVEPVKYSYLPFGAGPHVCMGQSFATLEMTLTLVVLFQHVRLVVADGYVAEPEPMMTLRPKGGLPMEVRKIPRSERQPGGVRHA